MDIEITNNQDIDIFPQICSNIDHALLAFRSKAAKLYIEDGAMWLEDNMEISAYISYIFLNLMSEQKFILKLIAYFDSELAYRLYGIRLKGLSRGPVTELTIKLIAPLHVLEADTNLAHHIYEQMCLKNQVKTTFNHSVNSSSLKNFQQLSVEQIRKVATRKKPTEIESSLEGYNVELDRLRTEYNCM